MEYSANLELTLIIPVIRVIEVIGIQVEAR